MAWQSLSWIDVNVVCQAMDHLFANFGGKPAVSSAIPPPPPPPSSTSGLPGASKSTKKRHISPLLAGPAPVSTASDVPESVSAKKLKVERERAKREVVPVVTDDLEIEAKREVVGNAGLGGGETEGLILSHAVRLPCLLIPLPLCLLSPPRDQVELLVVSKKKKLRSGSVPSRNAIAAIRFIGQRWR